LQAGLDDPNQVDPTGESFLKAHEHFLDPPAGYAPLIFPNRDGCGFGGVSGFRGLRKITLFGQLHEAEHVATGLLKQFTKQLLGRRIYGLWTARGTLPRWGVLRSNTRSA